MRKLPYIEPTIRTIAGALITIAGALLYFMPDLQWLGLVLILFVSLNLLQSGFSRICLLERILKKFRFRSELDEIKTLNKINSEHLATLNLLNEVVVELSWDGRIVRLTDSWGKLLGIENINVLNCPCLGKPICDYLRADDRPVLKHLLDHLTEGEVKILRFRMLRMDNSEHWIEGRFTRYGEARPLPVVRGVLRDVTESYLQEKQIAHMALHDALTNLPNRVLLEERMKRAISHAIRRERKVAALFIDLDNFKQVNDIYGHKAGDQLLITVSAILEESLRNSDTIARWGGDEFVVLLEDLQQDNDACNTAEKLLAAIREKAEAGYIDSSVTLSIGVAIFPDDADSSENLLVQADKALFFAKSQGRNNVQIYSRIRDNDLSNRQVDMTSRHKAVTWEEFDHQRSGRIIDKQ